MSLLFSLLQVAEPAPAVTGGIGLYALIFMLVSMGAVTTLTVWCFWRIISTEKHFDPDGTGPMHAPVTGEAENKPPRR
ncbi:MAG: hypothetical protein H0X65_06785 [Gemmatimonadetes bacterium]|nr:hypothetical protein [Gemmatimonadota bacterium]